MKSQPPSPSLAPPPTPAVVQATALFGQRRELLIQHGGERYRLSLTRNGKLILTK